MKKIKPNFIVPSAALVLGKRDITHYEVINKDPEIGDVIVGKVSYIGQHGNLENKEGRIHKLYDGTIGIFVFGNRYATKYYEGIVPKKFRTGVDMLARSGMVGEALSKSAGIKDPTRIEVLGYVWDKKKECILNTKNYPILQPRRKTKTKSRAKLILSIGTSMDSGKSTTAAAIIWSLKTAGHNVIGSKITGTASLKDILLMEDSGAKPVCDFTYLGYPSTYKLNEEELLQIFDKIDLQYANNPNRYWVVEIADGIIQRDTAILLKSMAIRERIYRLVFSAYDALGAIGGIKTLRDEFELTPDAISGICTSSSLGLQEIMVNTQIPVIENVGNNLRKVCELLI